MKTFLIILFLAVSAKAEVQLSLMGTAFHLLPTPKENVQYMKNKIDSNAIFAYNPQINLMLINDDSTLIHGAVLLDCYAHGAGFLAYGKRYKITNDFYYGFEIGAYVRQVPHPDDTGRAFIPEVGIYQIMPSPAAILQYQVAPKIFIRVQSNILLNLFDLAYEF